MISIYLEKIKRCLRKNGLWFTIHQIFHVLFGATDPLYDPRWPKIHARFVKRHGGDERQKQEKQVTTPLDICVNRRRTTPVYDLIIEDLNRDNCPECSVKAVLTVAKKAAADNAGICIITRSTPADPSLYYELLKNNGMALPASVSFFCDSGRDDEGKSVTRLEVGINDVFFADTPWAAQAALSTDLDGTVFLVPSFDSDDKWKNIITNERLVALRPDIQNYER